MAEYEGLQRPPRPDPDAMVANLLRKGTPQRVHHIELFHDWEIIDAIIARFDLLPNLDPDDPYAGKKKTIAVNRFVGLDHVPGGLVDSEPPLALLTVEDTADLKKPDGRNYIDEHVGPIASWEDFEKFPWPDPNAPGAARDLEWLEKNLHEDMCISAHTGHFCEYLCWLLGYESLCYALYDQRDLVEAVARKTLEIHEAEVRRFLEFDRVRIIWGSDDMGYKTGLMISADDLRAFVLSGHKRLAKMAHDAGRVYLLHSCGNLNEIIDELADDVKIDAKHSFEDTIEDVCDAKDTYGRKMALLGGIDVDFLCRADEAAIRRRVRQTLDVCMPGGGYCLGTGNSVTNYIPLENYLAMVDEGRLYAG